MTEARWLGAAFALVLAVLAIWSLRTTPPQPLPQSLADKLNGLDLKTYSGERYPRLHSTLGGDRAQNYVQAVRQGAAMAAAKDDRCDHVEASEYAERESRTGEITAFADCSNGFRIFYSHARGVFRTRSPLAD